MAGTKSLRTIAEESESAIKSVREITGEAARELATEHAVEVGGKAEELNDLSSAVMPQIHILMTPEGPVELNEQGQPLPEQFVPKEQAPTGQEGEPGPTEITPPGEPDIYTATPQHQIADHVLKAATGMDLKEWHKAIVEGKIGPHAVDVAGFPASVYKAVLAETTKRHGNVPSHLAKTLEVAAGLVAGFAYPPLGGAAKVAGHVAEGAKPVEMAAEAVDVAGRAKLAKQSPGLKGAFEAAGVQPSKQVFKTAESEGVAPLREALKDIGLSQRLGLNVGRVTDAKGAVNQRTALLMAQIAFGAATGAYTGNTLDEKIRNGLIGAGLGAAATPAVLQAIKSIATPAAQVAQKRADLAARLKMPVPINDFALTHGLDPNGVAQALDQLKNPEAKLNFLQWLWKYGPRMATAGYVSALLTTGKAWVVKGTSEATATLVLDAERLMQGVLDHAPITKAPVGDRASAVEAAYLLHGQFTSWRMGLDAAMQHMKDGRTMPVGFGTGGTGYQLDVPMKGGYQDIFQQAALAAGPYDNAVRFLGRIANMPSRPLGADTAMVWQVNFQGQLNSLARRHVANMIEKGELKKSSFASAYEAVLKDPPKTIVDQAAEQAHIATFSDPLVGGMAEMKELFDKYPFLRFAAPFYKIGTNLFRFSYERFPITAGIARRNRELLASGRASDRNLVLAKMATGTMVTAGSAWAVYEGRLRGRGPSNPDVRRAAVEEGWVPYSFSPDGKTWYGIDRLSEPLRTIVGLTADLAQIRGEMSDDDYSQAFGAILMAINENVMSKTFLGDVNTFFKAVMDSNPGAVNAILKVGEQIGESYAAPPLEQQIRRAVDPAKRETRGFGETAWGKELRRMVDMYIDRTPGWSKHLYPRVTQSGQDAQYDPLWGQPWLAPVSPVVKRTDKGDAVLIEEQRIGYAPPPLSPFIKGSQPPKLGAIDWKTGIDLTGGPPGKEGQWFYRYQKLAGNHLKVRGGDLHQLARDAEGNVNVTFEQQLKDLEIKTDGFYGKWDLLHLLLKSPLYKELPDGRHGGKAQRIEAIHNAFKELAQDVLIYGVPAQAGERIHVPKGWGAGDPILQQMVLEKTQEQMDASLPPTIANRARRLMQEKGMTKP